MDGLKRLAPQSGREVPVSLLKSYLRLDGDSEDNLLQLFIDSAHRRVEEYLSVSIMEESFYYKLDAPPILDSRRLDKQRMSNVGGYSRFGTYGTQGTGAVPYVVFGWLPESIILPVTPIRSVTSIKAYQNDGTEVVIDTASYTLENRGRHGEIIFDREYVWPPELRLVAGVVIEFVAGYLDEEVPPILTETVLELAAFKYNTRGEGTDDHELRILNKAEQMKTWGVDFAYPQ